MSERKIRNICHSPDKELVWVLGHGLGFDVVESISSVLSQELYDLIKPITALQYKFKCRTVFQGQCCSTHGFVSRDLGS